MLFALAMVSVLSASCNTFIGVGRDMRLAGEGMEKAATKAGGSSEEGSEAGGAPIY
jgi:predicted small secreted protein